MIKIAAFFTLFLILSSGCEQVDSNPEFRDPIYRDLSRELDLVNKNIATAEEEFKARSEELRGVIPQTGQIKTYEKKVFESKNLLERLNQQQKYFLISIDQRKEYARTRYGESLRGGRPWPDQKEIDQFEKAQKLQRQKILWDKNKGIVKDVPRGTKESKKINSTN